MSRRDQSTRTTENKDLLTGKTSSFANFFNDMLQHRLGRVIRSSVDREKLNVYRRLRKLSEELGHAQRCSDMFGCARTFSEIFEILSGLC